MNDKTAVYMTELEQEAFVRSLKYSQILKEFDKLTPPFDQIKAGSIELHFNTMGQLSSVVVKLSKTLR